MSDNREENPHTKKQKLLSHCKPNTLGCYVNLMQSSILTLNKDSSCNLDLYFINTTNCHIVKIKSENRLPIYVKVKYTHMYQAYTKI